jgi:hypothetical protein
VSQQFCEYSKPLKVQINDQRRTCGLFEHNSLCKFSPEAIKVNPEVIEYCELRYYAKKRNQKSK